MNTIFHAWPFLIFILVAAASSGLSVWLLVSRFKFKYLHCNSELDNSEVETSKGRRVPENMKNGYLSQVSVARLPDRIPDRIGFGQGRTLETSALLTVFLKVR